MKVCLIFQRRFTPVAHMIAQELQKRGVKEFCGYVYLRSSMRFLEEQKEISYKTLLSDEDIHDKSLNEVLDWKYLADLEREYGIPNLWPYLSVDRVLLYGLGVREYPHDTGTYSHEDLARVIQTTAKEIIQFLEEEKPDAIYIPAVSAVGNMLLYHIAKKKGIRVLTGAETRLGGGYALSEDYRSFTWVDARFRELIRGEKSPREKDAEDYLKEYRARPQTYHYVMESFKHSGARWKAFAWLSPQSLARTLAWLPKRLVTRAMRKHDYMEQSPWWFLWDALRRKSRLMRGFDDLYNAYDSKEKFAYYPLHLEPEMAMLLLAPRWTDQVNLIKQIAESLPLSFKLYVKEHPAMVGFRTRRYYKELKKIPNVKLIEPNHDSHDIIKNAKLVLTQTGTAGWEALMQKKPVITFGDVYYNSLSMSTKYTTIEKLPCLVKERLEDSAHNEKELVSYIAALLEDSADIRLHELWEKGLDLEERRNSISRFCDLLLSKVSPSHNA